MCLLEVIFTVYRLALTYASMYLHHAAHINRVCNSMQLGIMQGVRKCVSNDELWPSVGRILIVTEYCHVSDRQIKLHSTEDCNIINVVSNYGLLEDICEIMYAV